MGRSYPFILKGDIPSKKNSYRINLNPGIITYIKDLAKSLEKPNLKALSKFARLRPPKKYTEWEVDATQQFVSQSNGNLYFGAVEIWFTIFFPRKGRAGGDLDNKMTSIMDALVKSGVIMDDSYNCVTAYHAKGVYRKNLGGAELIVKDLTVE